MKGVPVRCFFLTSPLNFPISLFVCHRLFFRSSSYLLKIAKVHAFVARPFPFGLGDLPIERSHFV